MNFRIIKSAVALMLALIFAVLPLAGCKKENENADFDTNGNVLSEPVVIADGKEAYFKLLRPEADSNTMLECLGELMYPADGFKLTYATAKEADNENTDKEILIGNTCRKQSKDAMNAIGYDDFSITYVDNKIVVAAHNPERLIEAVLYLKENLLRVIDGKLEYIANYTFTSSDSLMIDKGESIADYKIVCGHDQLYMSAYDIKEYIKNAYGVDLEIIFDSQPKTGKEIVLGNAKRDICNVADTLGYSDGIIKVENKDILIATKDSVDTNLLFDIFKDEYLSGAYTDTFNFKGDLSRTVNIYEGIFKDPAKLAAGSDIRVMSFNVLCDLWGNPSVLGRQDGVMKTIKNYAPDVVGFQEFSDGWHRAIKSAIKTTPYKLILTEHDYVDPKYGNTNFTPILYNSDTLTLIECDTVEFTETDNRYMKNMSYAYFEHKASGKKFVALNTHYEAPGNDEAEKEENIEYRKSQTADMIALIAELEEKYDAPIVVTGDFNTYEGSDKTGKHSPYWDLVEKAELHEAKKSADKIQRNCTTYHELGTSVSLSPSGSFDHIFGNDKVKFTYFNTLVDKMLMSVSDHCPIYADVKLN